MPVQNAKSNRFDMNHVDDDNKNKSGLFSLPFASQAHQDEHMAGAQANQMVPPGVVAMFAGVTADVPEGWLRCDGAAVSRTTYSNLYEVIGETFGAGDGTQTFNIPDMRTRFPVGASGTVALAATGGTWSHDHANGTLAGASGGGHSHNVNNSSGTAGGHTHASDGSHTHTSGTLATNSNSSADTDNGNTGLQIASLDTHTHDVTGSTASAGGHTHGAEAGHTHGAGTYATDTQAAHTHAVTGSTAAANPPYIGLHFIIKT